MDNFHPVSVFFVKDAERHAEVRILIGQPIELPPRLDDAALEAVRARLEQRLIGMHTDLDARTGFTDSQPLRASPPP